MVSPIAAQGVKRIAELRDLFASREGDEDALCAICCSGRSVDPNLIVFCERCDIAVHQQCYGVVEIPEGEAVQHCDTAVHQQICWTLVKVPAGCQAAKQGCASV